MRKYTILCCTQFHLVQQEQHFFHLISFKNALGHFYCFTIHVKILFFPPVTHHLLLLDALLYCYNENIMQINCIPS